MQRKTLWLFAPLLVAGCLESLNPASLQAPEVTKPPFMVDEPHRLLVDGKTDDLISAGLGLDGLRAASAPEVNNDHQSLRRHAIYQNFNALLAMKDLDGYGRLYAQHMVTGGAVAGTEYLLPVRYSDHAIAALLMLQVPATFNPAKPCLVATASSGSRGIYGASGVVGAWALHQGCAVVTTDKGTGTGFYLLDEKLANHWLGHVLTDTAGSQRDAHFAVQDSAELNQFRQQYPHRIASRHAHSGHLPEQDWGRFVLQAIQFGFYQLNQHHRPANAPEFQYLRDNTLVLAAAISNGGAAVIAAAEQDSEQWIDGVVASEPNVFMPEGFSYQFNGQPQRTQSLLTNAAQTALLAPCAALAEALPSPLAAYQMPLFQYHFGQRCADLARTGLVSGASTAEMAADARAQLLAAGLTPEAQPLIMTSAAIHLWEAILVNYVNNFARLPVHAPACDLSYAVTDATGAPTAAPADRVHSWFGNSGIPPVDGIGIINNTNGRALAFSTNTEGKPDLAFRNIQCLAQQAANAKVQSAEAALAMTGKLQRPTLIVQGGADNLIQPAHHSRAYAVLNQRAEPAGSQLRYLEVRRGQHFDAFLNLPPLRTHFVPLHAYFEQSLDAMLEHLRDGRALPPSQLIDAAPAPGPLAPLASLPPIAFNAEDIAASEQHQALIITREGMQVH